MLRQNLGNLRESHDSDQRLRVVHVVLQLDTGGMEKLLAEFARHTNRRTTDLYFVSLGALGKVGEEIQKLGWPVRTMHEPSGLKPGLVFRLAKLFREVRADVVHAHNTRPLLYAAPAARLARVPVVVYTRHGLGQHSHRRRTMLLRWAAKLADHVVCVSRDSVRVCADEGMGTEKVCTIWNGIDTARFSYSGPAAGGPAVMVGRLSPEKDVQTLLEAAAIVVKSEPMFRLDIAGEGPCRAELEQKLRALGLGDHVRLLGNVSDVPALLAGASMSCLSSLTEGISLTLLEAMARGLPVVATAVGGNPEVVVDGETGLLVPPRNPALLADAMLKIWRDRQLGIALGKVARVRVVEHFDVSRMVAGYESLYRPDAKTQPLPVACTAA